MRLPGKLASYTGLLISAGICLLVTIGLAIVAVLVLSLIPTYVSKQDYTPTGEKYCIDGYLLILNPSPTTGLTPSTAYPVNSSYPLNQACYRTLQNTKSDNLLRACLLSNCTLYSPTNPSAGYLTCYAVIYYSARCSDQSASSGLNNIISSYGNSACRRRRLNNINRALGSSSTTSFTNAISLIINGLVFAVNSVTTAAFSSYIQAGAKYCGSVSQSDITNAIRNQAN